MDVLSKREAKLMSPFETTAEVLCQFSAAFQRLPTSPNLKSVRVVVEKSDVPVTGHLVEVLQVYRCNPRCVAAVSDRHVALHFRVLTPELGQRLS